MDLFPFDISDTSHLLSLLSSPKWRGAATDYLLSNSKYILDKTLQSNDFQSFMLLYRFYEDQDYPLNNNYHIVYNFLLENKPKFINKLYQAHIRDPIFTRFFEETIGVKCPICIVPLTNREVIDYIVTYSCPKCKTGWAFY